MASATLTVRRTWGRPLPLTREPEEWHILLDGKVAGLIGRDEPAEVSVEPGHHSLRLRSSSPRHISKERSFDVSEGQVASFSAHEPRWWPFFIAALIKPDLWIALRQD